MLQAFPEVKRKVLGLTREAGPVLAEGVVLNKAGVNQHTRKDEDSSVALTSCTNNKSAEGILARLKRDHPQIAQAFIEGEYPSAASAGQNAVKHCLSQISGSGKMAHPTPSPALEKAQAAFRRLTREDQNAFSSWRAEQSR